MLASPQKYWQNDVDRVRAGKGSIFHAGGVERASFSGVDSSQ